MLAIHDRSKSKNRSQRLISVNLEIAADEVDLCVTGLTSNPSIFDKAITGTDLYDASISGTDAEAVFFDLALDDLTRAADLLRTSWDVSDGMDGCVVKS